MAGEETFAAARELAARFGFLLRRKDQRLASGSVGVAGATARGGGVEAGGGEGCEETGELMEDKGDVCSKDSAGKSVSGSVSLAASELAALFLLRPRRKAGAGEGAGEGAGAVEGKEAGADEGEGVVAAVGADEGEGAAAGADKGAGGGEGEGASADKGERAGAAGADERAGAGWSAEQLYPVVSDAATCSARTLPVARPGPASQEVSGIHSVALVSGSLDGAAISTSVSVTMSSCERPSNASSSVVEPIDVSAKAGGPAVLLPASSSAASAHTMSVSS